MIETSACSQKGEERKVDDERDYEITGIKELRLTMVRGVKRRINEKIEQYQLIYSRPGLEAPSNFFLVHIDKSS